jgi:signal transduction histidine kinase
MHTTSRWVEQLERDIPGARSIVDPEAAAQRRAQRAYRFNAINVPALRLIGFILVSCLVYLHNRYILNQFVWTTFSVFTMAVLVYCAVSWVFLLFMYSRTPPCEVGHWIYTADVIAWTMAVYYSGGERSWLLFLMAIRVADQAYTGYRAVLFYAHLSVGSYVLMLLYIQYVDQRPIFGLATLTKVLCIYAANLYLAFTARAIEALRNSTRSAIRIARECITHLDEQAQQLHEHSEQLAVAKRQVEDANHAKSVFLTNMSHELLTPMNGIIGMTSLALETPLTAQQRAYLTTAQTSAATLLQLIHTLLDFSSMDAGQRALVTAPFALRVQVALAVDQHRDAAQAKGLTLAWTVAPDVPETVIGDAACVQQVLARLLDNAIKFTPRGSVSLTVVATQRTAEALTLLFALQDTGIGIPSEKQRMIFDPFAQVDGSTTRRYGGTGLGLALASKLVALLGGELWVESQEGYGSTFRFTVRVALPATSQTPPTLTPIAAPSAPLA